jgi:predicted glycogen debranching enzyme
MTDEGVTFVTGVDASDPEIAQRLSREYDAVVLCCGSEEPRAIGVDTAGVSGVYYAMEFLHAAVDRQQFAVESAVPTAEGRSVVIIGTGNTAAYNSVDAPLWFIRTLQAYANYTHTERKIWKEYGPAIKSIISAYKNGTLFNIRMLDNGLIYAGCEGKALTWMDAIVNGRPVTPRTGCQVEINALWYNDIKFAIDLASRSHDKEFVADWDPVVANFPAVFKETFWSKEIGYLADYVDGDYKNFQVRPNMLIAASLPFAPISEKIRQLILKCVT